MVTADDNPFVPGFGVIPPALSGREAEFGDLEAALRRVRRGFYEQPRLITGDRGMGKTAVLAELAATATTDGFWVVQVEAGESSDLSVPLLRDLRRVLLSGDLDARVGEWAKRAAAVLGGFAVKHAGVELEVAPPDDPRSGRTGDLATDLGEVFVATARAAAEHGTAVLLIVDEIQAMPAAQIGPLFQALQAVARALDDHDQYLPMLTVVAGLPDARRHMRDASSTYAERVREHALGPLTTAAASEALAVPVEQMGARWSPPALTAAAAGSGGYPYSVQLLGYESWMAASRRDPDAAELSEDDATIGAGNATAQLHRLYESRTDELPDSEWRYLIALTAVPEAERRSSVIAASLGGAASDWSYARARLIDRGLLRSTARGRVTFALPGLESWVASHHASR